MITADIKKLIPRNILDKLLKKSRKLYKLILGKEILVLGDSHVSVFYNKKFENRFKRHFFNVVDIGGATVSGLENPNSKTQAMPIFKKHLKKTKAKIVIVSLGEVDTGFVIWYRAEKYDVSVSKMLSMAIEKYERFLQELSKEFRVICVSTPLPTIKDGQNWGEIANARKGVKATQKQRIDLTIEFNENIEEFCKNNKILFVALDNKSLDKNGTIKSDLLNQNPNDHHYNGDSYSELLIQELKYCIEKTT